MRPSRVRIAAPTLNRENGANAKSRARRAIAIIVFTSARIRAAVLLAAVKPALRDSFLFCVDARPAMKWILQRADDLQQKLLELRTRLRRLGRDLLVRERLAAHPGGGIRDEADAEHLDA